MWPPSAPTSKRRGDFIGVLEVATFAPYNKKAGVLSFAPYVAILGPDGPHPFTPIGLTAVLWELTHQKGGISPHWDVNVAYFVNSSPDSKIPARPARRRQHPC